MTSGPFTPARSKWATQNIGSLQTGRPPLQCAMLLFPGFTMLDLIGPQTVLCGPVTTHLVAKRGGGVVSDSGLTLQPTTTFDQSPPSVDILFVPGGPGQADVFNDDETLSFLLDRGSRAAWVTAVCTGSLILGAAGLLKGYKATTHWAAMGLLPLFGAQPVEQRVVIDRNRITGGGVTAGIDFGLTLLAAIFGHKAAKVTQLLMEYDPAPPFQAGDPRKADESTVEAALEIMATTAQQTMDALQRRKPASSNNDSD